MWDLPWSGIKTLSLALADKFFTIEPQRKLLLWHFGNNAGTGITYIWYFHDERYPYLDKLHLNWLWTVCHNFMNRFHCYVPQDIILALQFTKALVSTEPTLQSPGASTTEPVCRSCWSWSAYSSGSATEEVTGVRISCTTTREPHVQQRRPSAAKNS